MLPYLLSFLIYPVWASRRSYTYSEGPPDLGVPEKLTFRWNHVYLVQNCAKNAIQTKKFWEKCKTDCFFRVARTDTNYYSTILTTIVLYTLCALENESGEERRTIPDSS